MKWIKASEYLPNKYPVCVRTDGGGAWFYETACGEDFFSVEKKEVFDDEIEWLDESEPQEQVNEDELWETVWDMAVDEIHISTYIKKCRELFSITSK